MQFQSSKQRRQEKRNIPVHQPTRQARCTAVRRVPWSMKSVAGGMNKYHIRLNQGQSLG
jgi:hypothetical protein